MMEFGGFLVVKLYFKKVARLVFYIKTLYLPVVRLYITIFSLNCWAVFDEMMLGMIIVPYVR